MIHITKTHEPKIVKDWKQINKNLLEIPSYNNANFNKRELLEGLLREQGYLCAYTMCRIGGPDNAHIEHMKSQRTCKQEDAGRTTPLREDLEYRNMVACVPGQGEACLPYGAQAKDSEDLLDPLYILPTKNNCDGYFVYSMKGEIKGAQHAAQAAESTIGLLKLNHDALTSLRHGYLVRLGLSIDPKCQRKTKKLSKNNVRDLINNAYQKKDNKYTHQFPSMVKQVAEKFLKSHGWN